MFEKILSAPQAFRPIGPEKARVPILVRSDQLERGTPSEMAQRRVPHSAGRFVRPRPADAPWCVRRVRATEASSFFCRAARRGPSDFSGDRGRLVASGQPRIKRTSILATRSCTPTSCPAKSWAATGFLTTITNATPVRPGVGALSSTSSFKASLRAIEEGRYLVLPPTTGRC